MSDEIQLPFLRPADQQLNYKDAFIIKHREQINLKKITFQYLQVE